MTTKMPPETEIISADNEKSASPAPALPNLEVCFAKSPYFRSIHALAAWYGADPQGNMHLTFYTEQVPLPEKLILKLNPDGTIASQEEIRGKFNFVKTAEVDISFTIQAAVDFYKSLGDNLKRVNAI